MTETAQPDPQVVAQCQRHGVAAPCIYCTSLHAAGFLPPPTRGDIPAGQGPASLYIGAFLPGVDAVYFKAHDGRLARVMEQPTIRTEQRALWDHLAATLPHVTTEEEA